MLAGLIGNTHGNWLTIKFLWVSEKLRRQSIGSQLLKKAEETAKERGCQYAFLDTFSFQAPEFYKKYGYKEQFKLEEYPLKGKRYYFTKTL
jgi:ribosomal protein S18 acetylase RimI-like enzyme